MPLVVNSQRKLSLDRKDLSLFAEELIARVSEASGRDFAVAIISDERMRQLNETFRGKNATTDVLSFIHEPDEFDPDKTNLGDIVISVEQADRQAAENGLSLQSELKQLMLHGVLHLCGYDHETDGGEMNTRELELREQLGI